MSTWPRNIARPNPVQYKSSMIGPFANIAILRLLRIFSYFRKKLHHIDGPRYTFDSLFPSTFLVNILLRRIHFIFVRHDSVDTKNHETKILSHFKTSANGFNTFHNSLKRKKINFSTVFFKNLCISALPT